MNDAMTDTSVWADGAAYVGGAVVPIAEAKIPITDWGYRRSDVTYDVVGVCDGAFFRLDDHLRRFRASMNSLRMEPPESDADIARILTELVRRTGPARGLCGDGLHARPAAARACRTTRPNAPQLACRASRSPGCGCVAGAAGARRARDRSRRRRASPLESVDPTVKNFHWGDLTEASFEAHDAGRRDCGAARRARAA